MTKMEVAGDDLKSIRTSRVRTIVGEWPDAHRRFLVPFERGQTEWELLGLRRVDKPPAIQWRRAAS